MWEPNVWKQRRNARSRTCESKGWQQSPMPLSTSTNNNPTLLHAIIFGLYDIYGHYSGVKKFKEEIPKLPLPLPQIIKSFRIDYTKPGRISGRKACLFLSHPGNIHKKNGRGGKLDAFFFLHRLRSSIIRPSPVYVFVFTHYFCPVGGILWVIGATRYKLPA